MDKLNKILNVSRRIRTATILLIIAFQFAGDAGWALTLQEIRQKLLDDYAFFDAQSALRRQDAAQTLVDSKNLTSESIGLIQTQQTPVEQKDQIYLWFSQNQQATPSGLIVSHPDDPGFIYHEGIQQEWAKILANTQSYTYDQALAGITMLKHGDTVGAKKIFDFFYSQQQLEGANFSGFWTVYNVDPGFNWKRYEWRKGLGENAWLALFALQYFSSEQQPVEKQKALELATSIGKWIGTLPHHQGGVAMSPDNPGGSPNFGTIYSVENNLDYYALLKALLSQTLSQQDTQFFTTKFNSLKNWLKTEALDASSGTFKRGGTFSANSGLFEWDTVKSLDVQSWSITAVGISTLINDFGINLDNFLSSIHQTFAAQEDGSFGGNIFLAKGFDFSDASNAASIGRSGIKWVEGTNQMILVYKMLADFYGQDPVKASYYQSLADYFLGRNVEDAIQINGSLSYRYADQSGVQIYENTPDWRTSPGQAAPSTAWVYFSINKINPFTPFQGPGQKPDLPFSESLSTSISGLNNLFIDVGFGNQAIVRFEDRIYRGLFDADNETIHLDNIQNSPFVLSEAWTFRFETHLAGSDLIYSLKSFESNLLHSDTWLYQHSYFFTPTGLLASDDFEQVSNNHDISQITSYYYSTLNEKNFVGATLSTTFFDGAYGYGSETHYAYEVDGNGRPLILLTTTQETRNNPFLRVLETYQLTIHDNGLTEFMDLGKQIIPSLP